MIAGRDASEVLELVEEAFDEIALTVEVMGYRALLPAIPLGRDVGARAMVGNELEDGAGVVAPRSATVSRAGSRPSRRAGTAALSEAWPGVITKRRGRPRPSTTTWILVLSPPRERPMAWSGPPFSARSVPEGRATACRCAGCERSRCLEA